MFWQNRSFYIGVGSLGTGTLNQQNVVALYNAFTTTRAASQPTADATTANGTGVIITGGTGACVSRRSELLGSRRPRRHRDPTNHGAGLTLSPTYSVITSMHGIIAGSRQHDTATPDAFSASTATVRGLRRSSVAWATRCLRASRTPPFPTRSST